MNAIPPYNPDFLLQMCSGRAWSLSDPEPAAIHWPDIAEQLAKVNRFVGATPGVTYSVAQHCCVVADMLPPALRPYGLLHDAPEAFSGDIPTPYKRLCAMIAAEYGAGDVLAIAEDMQARAIHAAAGLDYPLTVGFGGAIKHADLVALATEHRDMQVENAALWREPLPGPLTTVIRPWPWPKAADEWLTRLYRWCPSAWAREHMSF
ncbi:hypothetical protein [Oleispirillum naphthae]|uniref:hypothetical protein n=1 Tax=Oleispirillum naphthae TaxID=2838853 RepID=UPI0030824E83